MKVFTFVLALLPLFSLANTESFRRPIKDNLKDIKSCYQETLTKNPTAAGKIVLTWEINDEGVVIKATVNGKSTTLKEMVLQNCMIEKVKSWKFPPTPKGKTVEVNYPFWFNSKDAT